MERFCGVPDHFGANDVLRWPFSPVTWSIMASMPGISDDDFQACAEAAFASIRRACGIDLRYSPNGRTATVRLYNGRIDGPSGTLAWSEFPSGKDFADQKYDASEKWFAQPGQPPRDKISLVAVIAHEGCHAMGLPHGGGDLMAPTYNPAWLSPGPWTTQELIRRYGPPKPPTPVPTPPPPTIPPIPTPPGDDMERDELRKKVQALLAVANVIAGQTRTELDDKLVAGLAALAAQDWALDFVLFLLKKFGPAEAPSVEALHQTVVEFMRGQP